jgi:hypothetical protein
VTAIDTAYNYDHFASHRTLRQIADDILDQFEISTKVGFFPDRHDLSPGRLRAAVEHSTNELGRTPDTVLLHNPEQSPGQFTEACRLLACLRDEGLLGGWGISTWDARVLTAIPYGGPVPDVLMSRAGLMVPAVVLDAADRLAKRLAPAWRWGMAPFGQDTTAPVWQAVDTTVFLAPGQEASRIEAAFVAAFELPLVSRIAVGTRCADHLTQLSHARLLETAPGPIATYRHLLRTRVTASQQELSQPAREHR